MHSACIGWFPSTATVFAIRNIVVKKCYRFIHFYGCFISHLYFHYFILRMFSVKIKFHLNLVFQQHFRMLVWWFSCPVMHACRQDNRLNSSIDTAANFSRRGNLRTNSYQVLFVSWQPVSSVAWSTTLSLNDVTCLFPNMPPTCEHYGLRVIFAERAPVSTFSEQAAEKNCWTGSRKYVEFGCLQNVCSWLQHRRFCDEPEAVWLISGVPLHRELDTEVSQWFISLHSVNVISGHSEESCTMISCTETNDYH